MAITETSTGIHSISSLAPKLIRHHQLNAKSHAPLSRFVSLCHCDVESKKIESRRVKRCWQIIGDNRCHAHDRSSTETLVLFREVSYGWAIYLSWFQRACEGYR